VAHAEAASVIAAEKDKVTSGVEHLALEQQTKAAARCVAWEVQITV